MHIILSYNDSIKHRYENQWRLEPECELFSPPLNLKNQGWIKQGINPAIRVATRVGDNTRFADPVADRTMNMTVDPELGMTCVYKFIEI
jgi:hypothetical protein